MEKADVAGDTSAPIYTGAALTQLYRGTVTQPSQKEDHTLEERLLAKCPQAYEATNVNGLLDTS